MTGETKKDETAAHESAAAGGAGTPGKSASLGRDLLPLPALVAIALYLLLLSGVIILGVVSRRHYPPLFLVFSALFMAASAGLLMLFRWAWAMALATVLLLAIYNLWIFTSLHQLPMLIQGLLNLVFFLYLIRPEVRCKLK
jgi:hypothetical protein